MIEIQWTNRSKVKTKYLYQSSPTTLAHKSCSETLRILLNTHYTDIIIGDICYVGKNVYVSLSNEASQGT